MFHNQDNSTCISYMFRNLDYTIKGPVGTYRKFWLKNKNTTSDITSRNDLDSRNKDLQTLNSGLCSLEFVSTLYW